MFRGSLHSVTWHRTLREARYHFEKTTKLSWKRFQNFLKTSKGLRKADITGPRGLAHPVEHLRLRSKEMSSYADWLGSKIEEVASYI